MADVPPRTVLVVDDDAHVLSAFARMLQRRGVTSWGAPDLATARSLFRRMRPRACVVDMQLPDGSGIEFIREVRSTGIDVHLVLVTGYGCMEVGAAAVRAGADAVFAKPLSAAEIARVIDPQAANNTVSVNTPSADRALWEHIRRVLSDCGGNKSLAAKKLRIHRGTLQRWLDRPAPQA